MIIKSEQTLAQETLPAVEEKAEDVFQDGAAWDIDDEKEEAILVGKEGVNAQETGPNDPPQVPLPIPANGDSDSDQMELLESLQRAYSSFESRYLGPFIRSSCEYANIAPRTAEFVQTPLAISIAFTLACFCGAVILLSLTSLTSLLKTFMYHVFIQGIFFYWKVLGTLLISVVLFFLTSSTLIAGKLTMRNMGNAKSNGIYNPNELRNPPPPNLEDGERDSEMEQYIRAKYEYRKYIDRNALVASKLGPSRNATSTTPRSASSPLTSNARSSTLPSSSTASSSKPTSSPLANSETVSQSKPPVAPQNLPQAKPASQGGVWDDLIQLQDQPASSTLPLQYQQQSAASLSMGLTAAPTGLTQGPLLTGSLVTTPPVGLGINPFQQLQFQQQPAAPPSFATSAPSFTPSLQFNQNLQASAPSYGQQLFMNQTGLATGAPQASQFFQPQPQSASIPLQNPTPQGFLTPSPSQGIMSAPVTQTQFMTPSPNQQFLSHSPQPQFQPQATGMQQQQMFMTPSPQPIMGMGGGAQSYSPGPGMMMGQFGVGGMAAQQTQFQLQQQQQQQQQQQGQFLQGLPDQMLSPANFQAAGGMSRNPFAPQHRGTF
ncbi:hypothetical protein EST38_g3608 [Candolleomyces aberdarensis]|uniref:Uncharacterized protein n=1 Tax=Candolleomyces aberdarensis TaxID=2316362 RepID=A0A4Q2DQB8_9AGAR|nr:hypothetical protein EST38_g3608 [Candolleomyces aberdarensis]